MDSVHDAQTVRTVVEFKSQPSFRAVQLTPLTRRKNIFDTFDSLMGTLFGGQNAVIPEIGDSVLIILKGRGVGSLDRHRNSAYRGLFPQRASPRIVEFPVRAAGCFPNFPMNGNMLLFKQVFEGDGPTSTHVVRVDHVELLKHPELVVIPQIPHAEPALQFNHLCDLVGGVDIIPQRPVRPAITCRSFRVRHVERNLGDAGHTPSRCGLRHRQPSHPQLAGDLSRQLPEGHRVGCRVQLLGIFCHDSGPMPFYAGVLEVGEQRAELVGGLFDPRLVLKHFNPNSLVCKIKSL